MSIDNSEYVHEWFVIAEKDLKRAKLLANESDWEGAGFNLQQSLEKFLKGYLISNGWELQRTHDLVILINYAIEYDNSFTKFEGACRKISTYYMWDRYPKIMEEPLTKEDITESLKPAEDLINLIRNEYFNE